jgi:hypothetical protein
MCLQKSILLCLHDCEEYNLIDDFLTLKELCYLLCQQKSTPHLQDILTDFELFESDMLLFFDTYKISPRLHYVINDL